MPTNDDGEMQRFSAKLASQAVYIQPPSLPSPPPPHPIVGLAAAWAEARQVYDDAAAGLAKYAAAKEALAAATLALTSAASNVHIETPSDVRGEMSAQKAKQSIQNEIAKSPT